MYQIDNTLFVQEIGKDAVKVANSSLENTVLLNVSDDAQIAHVGVKEGNQLILYAYTISDKKVKVDEVQYTAAEANAPTPSFIINKDGTELMAYIETSLEKNISLYTKTAGWQQIKIDSGDKNFYIATGFGRVGNTSVDFSKYQFGYYQKVEHLNGCFIQYSDKENIYQIEGVLYYPFDGASAQDIIQGPVYNIDTIQNGLIVSTGSEIYGVTFTENAFEKKSLYAEGDYPTYIGYGDNPFTFYATAHVQENAKLLHIEDGKQNEVPLPGKPAFTSYEYDGFQQIVPSQNGKNLLAFTKNGETDTDSEQKIQGNFMVDGKVVFSFDETIPEPYSTEGVWSYTVGDNNNFFYGRNGYENAQLYFFNGKELISVLDVKR